MLGRARGRGAEKANGLLRPGWCSVSFEEDTNMAHELRITRCRTCNARIIWFKTADGKNMPVDADTVEPDDDVNELDLKRHVSHFATCKDADHHRKVAHVKRAGQTRSHTCHWTGCKQQVPPAMWGCRSHWFKLPKALRDRIWSTYRPGQEETLTPSAAYLEAAQAVQQWIRSQSDGEVKS